MNLITRRLSVPELSQQILEMAKTGVYRESVLEALSPLATKRQIRQAIAHAKRFGLHSVASLRDAELGTYYQVDLVKYRSLQHTVLSPVHYGDDAELVQRVSVATQALQRMLWVSQGLAIALVLFGIVCMAIGQKQASFGLLSSALSVAVVWLVQRSLSKPKHP
jgi:hypothetical protein